MSQEKVIVLNIKKGGSGQMLYDEDLDLAKVGRTAIVRASTVEPDSDGKWFVDFAPIGINLKLGPFDKRSEALAAEHTWLDENHIRPGKVVQGADPLDC